MTGKKGTSWIQNLNKESLIAELEERGIDFEETANYNELRELLRNTVKEELRKASEDGEHSRKADKGKNAKKEKPEASDSSTESLDTDIADSESVNITMSDGVKLNFTLNKDDWETYVERLEMYFIAHDVKTEKKAAQLLTRLDEDAFKLVKQLVAPEKVAAKTYTDLVKIITEHLAPKPSEVMERCKFNSTKQEANESVAEFTARLKKLRCLHGHTYGGQP